MKYSIIIIVIVALGFGSYKSYIKYQEYKKEQELQKFLSKLDAELEAKERTKNHAKDIDK